MKTYKILLPIFLLMSCFTFSQGFMKQKKEKIKALKVAYITEELQLTPEEASKFWPLYNAFEDKQKEFKQEKKRAYLERMDGTEIDKLTDKEAISMLSQIENNEEELYQLRKKFTANLKGVIPAIKIIKLKKAEEGFNRKLLQQYRDKFKD